jgi:hypothetical protein
MKTKNILYARFFVLFGLAFAAFFPPPARAIDSFSFKQIDKQLHMSASYGLALTGTRFLQTKKIPRWEAVVYASLITLAVGASKELFLDSTFSSGDMLANSIGVATSALVVFTFEF